MAAITDLQFQKYIGATPESGILFSLQADTSARNILGYDRTSNTLVLPEKVSVGYSADAAVQALTASNASAGVNAQAIIIAATATVSGQFAAINGAGVPGMHLGALSNHALYLITNATQRAKILPSGEMIVGASDVGGTEQLRVLLGIRAGGKMLSGAATSLMEVAASQVGSRHTFFGDGSGWQLRWARQNGYGAAVFDLMMLTDGGTLSPITNGAGALGTSVIRWAAVHTNTLRVGGPVAAPGRTEALQLLGSLYGEGNATLTGSISAVSYQMSGATAFDRSAGYARMFDDSGARVGLMIGNAATSYRTWYGANSHEFFERTLGAQLAVIDDQVSASQTGLSLNIGGALRRVLVGAADSAGAGRRTLTVLN